MTSAIVCPALTSLKELLIASHKLSRGIDIDVVISTPIVISQDRKSTRLNSSHLGISYAVFCLKKKKKDAIYKISDTELYVLARSRAWEVVEIALVVSVATSALVRRPPAAVWLVVPCLSSVFASM